MTDHRSVRDVVERAAARLRHDAAQDQYRGLSRPWVAFGLCALLDEIARHSGSLDERTLSVVLDVCSSLTRKTPRCGQPATRR